MTASLGKVALGLASLVVGAKYLREGARHLAAASTPRDLGRVDPSSRYPWPNRLPSKKAVHDTGFVDTQGGRRMRMRSYEIKTLDDRIAYLRRLVNESKRDPRVYAFARDAITQRCGDDWCIKEKDNLAEARAIYNAVRKRIRYTSDIAGVDTYQKPAHTLALKSGDCDDYSSLLCASMLSVGIPCRFAVIRTKTGLDWNHIYAQAGFPRANPKRWISMDASVPVPFGWEAPASMVAAKRVFPVE